MSRAHKTAPKGAPKSGATGAPANAKAGHGPGHGPGLLQLVLAALALTGFMYLLEHTRKLDFLDVIGLRLAAPLQVAEPVPTRRVEFRLIDVDTYVHQFNGSSPLNPATLADWLGNQVPPSYGALMIDLQLEPWPGQDRQHLDDWLVQHARQAPLVLPLPQLGWTADAHARSYAWMKQMCAAGVQFADPRLREHQGWVVRLDQLPHTLAQVTRQALTVTSTRADASHEAAAAHSTAPDSGHGATAVSICDATALAPSLETLYDYLDQEGQSLALHHTAPLKPGYVAALARRSTVTPAPDMTTADCPSCLVVVGGSYAASDRFRVPSLQEPANGAVVHAAAVLEESQMRGNVPLTLALDWLFGVTVGWLLGRREAPPPWPWAAPVLIGGLTLLPLVLAGVLMDLGLWVNPLPLVLGMWLHAKAHPLIHAVSELTSAGVDRAQRALQRHPAAAWLRRWRQSSGR